MNNHDVLDKLQKEAEKLYEDFFNKNENKLEQAYQLWDTVKVKYNLDNWYLVITTYDFLFGGFVSVEPDTTRVICDISLVEDYTLSGMEKQFESICVYILTKIDEESIPESGDGENSNESAHDDADYQDLPF
ncbi:MAG TPA: hypothetical protein PLG47_06475 [Candidatus Dojkabacteria bacterium]|nr:hypothetical protein [Candidatus Dojkabacteria bacterium]